MKKSNLEIAGAFAFSVEKNADERGSLVRLFDSIEFFPNFKVVQASYVENSFAGTLRGLHFQTGQHAENKIVQCIKGKIFDVIVDIDEKSITYGRYCSIHLGPLEEFQGIFIPKSCAHGYVTLSDKTDVSYFMDKEYSSENAKGMKWDDPMISIIWPMTPIRISKRDTSW